MNKKIVITGAKGFTAQHACQHFLSQGYHVIPIARGLQTDECTLNLVDCDLTQLSEVEKVIKDTNPDFILHLAGKNHAGESWHIPGLFLESNVMGTVNILEAVRKYKPDTKILITGSMLETSLATDKPNHPYGLSKTIQSTVALAWHYLYQLSVSVVRPPNLIGPGNSTGVCSQFAKKIVKSEKEKEQKVTLTVNNSGIKRAFLDVRDAVSIYAYLLEHGKPGSIYELDQLESYTLIDIVEHYQSLSSCSIEKEMINVDEQPTIQAEERNHLILGGKIERVPYFQSYSLQQSLTDILEYYRKAI